MKAEPQLQQNGNYQELMELGGLLSSEICCAVHYPAHEKHMFECECGITFPVFLVKSKNWKEVRKIHARGYRE
jgi:hypothetical protein